MTVRPALHQRIVHAAAACILLAVGVAILTFTMSASNAANRDFISYWAAGRQLVHHLNPYDGPAILRLESAAGFQDPRPFFMRNAPSAFFLALPLGFVGERAGAILWSLLIVGCLMASIRMLRGLYSSGQRNDVHLFGYLFPPVLACILAGQTGVFVLLGVVLFLRFQSAAPAIAGAVLLLCALKPHVLLPFGAVLWAWALLEKRYRLLLGAFGAFVASCVLAVWLDPHGWAHYAVMMKAAGLQEEMIPTPSLLFRLLIDRKYAWLQFVPALFACGWALGYFWRYREEWDWLQHGQLLLLVSLAVAPYAWFTDQAVVLPAFVGSLYLADRRGQPILPLMVLPAIALLEVLAGVQPNSPLYLWTSFGWIAVYGLARRAAKGVRFIPD